jgi:hypothetical protein
MKKLQILLAVLLVFSISANADFLFFKKKKKIPAKTEAVAPKKDADTKGPKPFAQVITKGARSVTGFITVHKVDNKYFFEIPDSVLGRDLLIVNRISKSAVGSRKGFLGYAGDEINEDVIRFEKGTNDKIFLKTVSYSERSSDSLGMYRNVLNSNILPIMSAFDVKAYKKDSINKTRFPVIDVTDFVNSDNVVLNFDEGIKKYLNIGNFFTDRSYIDTIRTYPENLEIRTVKTYAQKPQNPNDVVGAPFTFELNSSIVLLPKVPMKPRYFDPRVAYFATGYIDFDKNPQGIENVRMITRWRLEPKEEDMEKYNRGELVEPKKPIVFYIDPTTPKKWIPYLIQGINDWQKAFEKAGFKNAIYALEAPKDSTWSLDDARHSAIVYKPSNVPNASGPHVHDPRSGEIIETHINWYHNVMELLHNWYFIQTAAVDPRARNVKFDDELMGQLIRFVSSHEVGHTLGLRHNFGSSATIPVEKLRDKEWVEANGHTPSIMDYARFNYVAQPEDSITDKGLFPRIGIYDDWSIEWGYRYYPQFTTPQAEVPYLDSLVVTKLNSDKRYTFGTETDSNDPRNQSEDLGDNAMQASRYGIKNLQRIVPNLLSWTKEADKDYSKTTKMYYEVINQYSRYMGHVTKNVAGIYTTPKKVEQSGSVVEFVPASIQKDALVFLDEQLFVTPTWLINKDLIEKAQVDPVERIGSVQRFVINRLLSKYTFDKMIQNETLNGSKAFTVVQMLDMLKSDIWSGMPKDTYRRNLQKFYVDALVNIVAGTVPGTSKISSDATGMARLHLMQLRSEMSKFMSASTGITKAHFVDLVAQIDTALDTKK